MAGTGDLFVAGDADRPPLRPEIARLDGRAAVVTGGGAGIGRGIAAGLAAFGASVAVWERDPATAAAVAEEIGGFHVVVDVRDGDAVDGALAATLEHFGAVDVLVNNAGGTFRAPLLETSDGGFDALHQANLGHVLRCTRRVAVHMVERGRGGSIINVTSIEGVRAAPGYAAYAAAKAGVINLTQTAAVELAPHAVRVNALAPDLCLTEGLAALAGGEGASDLGATVPLGRPGHVDDLAGAAVFLASELSSYVTGQTLHVDGGTHAAGGWYRHDGDWVLGPPR